MRISLICDFVILTLSLVTSLDIWPLADTNVRGVIMQAIAMQMVCNSMWCFEWNRTYV